MKSHHRHTHNQQRKIQRPQNKFHEFLTGDVIHGYFSTPQKTIGQFQLARRWAQEK